MSFSRRVLHMDPCPWPTPRQGRRRDGIPTYTPSFLRQDATPRTSGDLVSCPSRARSLGEPRTLAVTISLTVRQNTALLTDRYRPHLCKAGVGALRRVTSVPRESQSQSDTGPSSPRMNFSNSSSERPSSVSTCLAMPRLLTSSWRRVTHGNPPAPQQQLPSVRGS
jgi:hypothetical protein